MANMRQVNPTPFGHRIYSRSIHLLGPQTGFTLLEVMIALAIFAMASLTVMQVSGTTLSHQARLKERMLGDWLADNQSALLYLQAGSRESALAYQTQQGETVVDGQPWYWRTRAVAGDNRTLQAMDIEISRKADFSALLVTRRIWLPAPLTELR
ncbi:type II secretion system minor pseudopilin GspI [Plesiomonas shigelloides]|uniref:type II secretion system minor pseudopilin GspI n=1 Tax=Plesiomonas shigelloides TaxID=703 RepID=UPI0012622AD6|nr:type II secretion system minor pseudopilin GspI [Plesiomonas shigelloides]KAB7670210.1 type II secretion system protein GspI [Plesiomonas shigelloides]